MLKQKLTKWIVKCWARKKEFFITTTWDILLCDDFNIKSFKKLLDSLNY